MKKFLLLTTILLVAVCAGCQPRQQDIAVTGRDRIEEKTFAGEDTVAEPGHMADVREGAPQAPPEEDVRPDAGRTTQSEETASPVTEPLAGQAATTPKTPQIDEETPAASDEKTRSDERTQDAADAAKDPAAATATDPTGATSAGDSQDAAAGETNGALGLSDDLELVGTRIYAAYRDLLSTYVDKNGNVDYATLRRKRGELYGLARDLDSLDPLEHMQWNRKEKMAFWLNAYNIFTLKVVIDNYPIEPSWAKVMLNYPKNSIIHISDPWTKKYFKVMGMENTLREIERGNLLLYGDPRVCLALSYASMGGAMLRNEPYDPDRLDEQLDDQAHRFLADARGFEIDRARAIVYLADIFNWYKQDFIAKYGDIRRFRDKPKHIQAYLNFVVNYIGKEDVQYLETQTYTVEFRKYDWRLNEQPNK